jgi:hypothetical protein
MTGYRLAPAKRKGISALGRKILDTVSTLENRSAWTLPRKTFGEQFTKQNGSDTNSDAMATRKEHQPTKIIRTTNDHRPTT